MNLWEREVTPKLLQRVIGGFKPHRNEQGQGKQFSTLTGNTRKNTKECLPNISKKNLQRQTVEKIRYHLGRIVKFQIWKGYFQFTLIFLFSHDIIKLENSRLAKFE